MNIVVVIYPVSTETLSLSNPKRETPEELLDDTVQRVV